MIYTSICIYVCEESEKNKREIWQLDKRDYQTFLPFILSYANTHIH